MNAPSARENILARLRAAPGRGGIPCPAIPSALPENAGGATRFAELLEAAHAEVIRLKGEELGRRLADYCLRRGWRRLLVPADGLPFDWPADAAACVIERFDRPLERLKSDLFDAVDAGVTVADGGIVDTGTLFQHSSPTQPRTLSLVPPVHLCVLDAARLHPTLGAAMTAGRWADGLPTNLVFVSGPSKTADIQQTLAYGAHGPKELVVFLYEGAIR